jgi:uncharacterized membrane protein (DUF485 family)
MTKGTLQAVLIVIVTIVAVAGVIASFIFFTHSDLTANEQVLFSIITTVCSLVFSWILSHIYYQKSNEQSLDTLRNEFKSNLILYASKAAEKVNNLSAELIRLSVYLQSALDERHNSETESASAKVERIQSTIHIINTLKSINDGSLSDWKGVIPEEIKELEDTKRAEVENITKIISEYQDFMGTVDQRNEEEFEDHSMREEIKVLNQKLDLAINSITGISTRPKVLKNKEPLRKEEVASKCPECETEIFFEQKPSPTSLKKMKCENCSTVLVSKWSINEGFLLLRDEPILEDVKCPECDAVCSVALRLSFASYVLATCIQCTSELKVTRRAGTIDVKTINDKMEEGDLEETFIQSVKTILPPQPWPTGTSKLTAEKLGVLDSKVRKAVKILIKRGDFKYQFDGKLYVMDSETLVPLKINNI